MKKIFVMRTVLLLAAVLFILQSFGQGSTLTDLRSVSASGNNSVPPAAQDNQGASRDACLYIYDDGTVENSLGLTAGGDLMWLNYFTVVAGCESINTVYVCWGTMANGGPCRIILYEDPDDDGNPDDAVYLTETTTTVQNAWPFFNPGETLIFTTVSITPTTVSGGFFVAALCQNQVAGEYPAPMDETTTSQVRSWVAYNGGSAFDVNILTNNAIVQVDAIGYPCNLMLRAEAGAASVPLSNWALFIGIGLILVFAVLRFRKMF